MTFWTIPSSWGMFFSTQNPNSLRSLSHLQLWLCIFTLINDRKYSNLFILMKTWSFVQVFFFSFTKCYTIIIFKSVHFYMYMYLYQSIKNKFQNYFKPWMYWNHKIHHPYIGADWKYIKTQVWLAKFVLSIHPSTDPFIHPSSL